MTKPRTEATNQLPRTALPLGIAATVLRSRHSSSNGTVSDADELVITAITDKHGTLTELPPAARARRLDPGQPEAWLYQRTEFGRRLWAIVPAMPPGHRRDQAAVRRYLSGWMASGNFASLQDPASVVEFYGAVALHDHREWPPTLPGSAATAR